MPKPAATLATMSGPWLRRGTIITAAGIVALGATALTLSAIPSAGVLTRNVCGNATTGSRRPWNTVLRPLGEAGSDTRRSWYTSVTSVNEVVRLHTMRSLLPSSTYGSPGSVAPITSNPGAVRWLSYEVDGVVRPRCGSLARIGLPVADNLPAITN